MGKDFIKYETSKYIENQLFQNNCVNYYSWLKENGLLFTYIPNSNILFPPILLNLCKQHKCFENSQAIHIVNKDFKYYEGVARVNGSFCEHAINVYKGIPLDFTCKKIGMIKEVEFFFGASLEFETTKEYQIKTKRTKENNTPNFDNNKLAYYYLKQTH